MGLTKLDGLGDGERRADRRGSVWRRWDPHVHTPGTALNDQYRGADAWDQWLEHVNAQEQAIEVLGVTDYWSVDNYVKVLGHWVDGRLPKLRLAFPNVELRLVTGTAEGSPVNAHLLVSPEDPAHVTKIQSLLQGFSFAFREELFRCNREDLIRLGRLFTGPEVDDQAALSAGSNQFKVELSTLRTTLRSTAWAREHVLLAVAAGSGDGSSGLRQPDGSFDAVREEIERSAQVIFSGRPGDHRFWSGRGVLDAEAVATKYGGLKACIHGSDAHKSGDVGAPSLDRRTWIKGDPTFDSLRQACLEPSGRTSIGAEAPSGALPHQVVDSVRLRNAPWSETADVPLNPGLVGIIGARGSGKTALADLIAGAAGFVETTTNERSFLHRAGEHLTQLEIEVEWGDKERSRWPAVSAPATPQVQYLSQQFVERLCSAEGDLAEELVGEIERVLFNSHSTAARAGTSSFAELRERATRVAVLEQQRCKTAIADTAAQLNEEIGKRDDLARLKAQEGDDAGKLEQWRRARTELTVTGGEERAAQLGLLNAAVEERESVVAGLERQQRAVDGLRAEVESLRAYGPEREADRLRSRHAEAGLSAADWAEFRVIFVGDVEAVLVRRDAEIAAATRNAIHPEDSEPQVPYRSSMGADELRQLPLAAVRARVQQLQAEIGLDARRQQQLRGLNEQIATAEIEIAQLRERIQDAEGAAPRITQLRSSWHELYGRLFEAIELEERTLKDLYEPLATAIAAEDGMVADLAFSVRRDVDVSSWANEGERHLDLRTGGELRGQGTLEAITRRSLAEPWAAGSAAEVLEAMRAFRDTYDSELIRHARVPQDDRAAFRAWGAQISQWLASVDHVQVSYGIQYGGLDIERLSPGTRGIVLLLLYLAIDRHDERPLIIDQPEENLDPRSIFQELVKRFRSIRDRRQVLIVTHNANLVVNTDVDQVIVASAVPNQPGQLPSITWTSGGLENPEIREEVCSILEGGAEAFRQRAKRLRIRDE